MTLELPVRFFAVLALLVHKIYDSFFSNYIWKKNTNKFSKSTINYALIGAGSFALGMHMPNLTKLKGKYHLSAVMSRKGHSAKVVGEQYGADYVTTSYQEILSDNNIDLVIICTRHDSHGDLVLKALKAGKNVFVEKPLAVNQDELNSIREFYLSEPTQLDKPILMVGFNRRFSQFSNEIKKRAALERGSLFRKNRKLSYWNHIHYVASASATKFNCSCC